MCDVCNEEVAERQISAPGAPILVGEGFFKPSQGGSIVNKRDVTKFIKEENFSIESFGGEKVGRKMFEKQVVQHRRKRKQNK